MRHPATPVLNALAFQPHPRRIEQTPALVGLDYAELSIPTADGETLHGWWVRAPRSVGHVLFAHGNGGNIGDRVPIFALLAETGFDVLAFDYRGYGRSSGRPSERGTELDARAARAILLEQPGVDPERVLYLGKSLGGAVMLELALAHPPAGLILMSTFTGMREAARSVYPFLPAPLIPDAYPSLRRIPELRVPVLLMHGDQDELLPLEHARRLYAAAPDPKKLVVYPGAGHNDIIALAGGLWIDTVTTWVREVCPI
ncbi:alpha/beta hydrolase [Nocardia cyriacigeorgica]|uniref:Alpha/beta fold hydrolase n=2 Tax=Nocardia cyriacigeorgica TaxID=135487 RepID=A0A6P1D289_9NOCA|nr:alpha/beta fold hydrolase [Nocardia cyriacigeorgica]NEW44118.1 alpha/beta fold hydrolase [Nocardia cyriacigeorgica]